MLDRYVYFSRFRTDGRLVAVLNPGADWSPRNAADVAADIESAQVRYLIDWESGPAEVRVCSAGPGGPVVVDAAAPDGSPGGLRALPRA